MKTLLLLLLTCLPLCAATTYTVLSDNTNRTITGGTTNLSFLNATNQVFTGTNTFSSFAIAQGGDAGWTNMRSFYRNTQIATRVLLKTNFGVIQFFDANTNATSPSSNGGYEYCKAMYEFTIPALLGSNSVLNVSPLFYKTNATLSSGYVLVFAGPQTNFCGTSAGFGAGATEQKFAQPNFALASTFANVGSYTLQFGYPINGNSASVDAPINILDTSIPFKIYLGFTSTLGATNIGFYGFQIVEQVMSP